MQLSTLERARRYLAKCPPSISGQGGHNAAYRAAVALVHGFALEDGDARALLMRWNTSCVPPWSDAELLHKVQSAGSAQHARPRGYLAGKGAPQGNGTRGKYALAPRTPKPMFCPMVLKRVAAKAGAITDIFAFVTSASPVPVAGLDSAGVLHSLYPKGSGERVLIFSIMKSKGQLLWEADTADDTKKQPLPAGDDGVWFLPQPVDGEYHPNPRQGGKLSRRSEESVTAWRYAVLESDEASADEWLRCLVQMPLRITSICESGGRSIHALVRVDAASKKEWDANIAAIKCVLVTLGADAGALSAVRLTRLPQAARGGRLQRLLYLNPSPDGRPIWDGRTKGKARDE